jgi:hypothetical protein
MMGIKFNRLDDPELILLSDRPKLKNLGWHRAKLNHKSEKFTDRTNNLHSVQAATKQVQSKMLKGKPQNCI